MYTVRTPTGTGMGGPGYRFADEKITRNYVVGTLAMANAGPTTNGSQFFINVAPTAYLNGKHTIFGEVAQGYDVVEKISKVATGESDKPLESVVINKIEIE